MKLYYDEILLGTIMTNHSMTVDEALDCLGIDMDKFAAEQDWDDWDWFALRMEY